MLSKIFFPFLFFPVLFATAKEAGASKQPLLADLIAASKPTHWRSPKLENLLYMELASGRVIIELAPEFAPKHVDNIKALAQEKYWDGLAIVRVQDNYVVQWADPEHEKAELKRKIKKAKETLPAEFDRSLDPKISFVPLPDKDVYAPETGFSEGFAAARDSISKKMWLLHCYGSVGAGRDNSTDSGGGTELYAVIGHAPRHLDRNVTLVGRVIHGIELLSSLPRGKGAMGFFEKPEEKISIKSVRVGMAVPAKDRLNLEVLRTDTPLFEQVIESRRNRREEWFHFQAGAVEVCNVPVVVREKK